ncbi:hypothetical protein BTIS_1409 [Bifidobacterium tissieri]|uniref:DUF4417 domain-containing protein n=1 Tax=Bifidobacterium tissieri TaxID=1630162 RepID=A0A261FE60_9BIFI|nr:DUF4417 domain-containing protein [Bifidobacterium tissieri]OZG57315.1 hypothetical protein BTIS_1409 [Bifidobacterium tissieri]
MIHTLVDILKLIEQYQHYLEQQGVNFDSQGFPHLRREWYLKEWPDVIVTYKERKSTLVKNPSNTVLCFYCADGLIYPRLEHALDEIDNYRPFMGIIGSDVTVTEDMDIEWQRTTILLNQLFNAILAVNGIRIAQNLRIGLPSTLACLLNIPANVMCASSTLGCSPTQQGDISYSVKLHTLRPSAVMLYGKEDLIMEQQLDSAGIPYRRYDDVHTLYKTNSFSLRTEPRHKLDN